MYIGFCLIPKFSNGNIKWRGDKKIAASLEEFNLKANRHYVRQIIHTDEIANIKRLLTNPQFCWNEGSKTINIGRFDEADGISRRTVKKHCHEECFVRNCGGVPHRLAGLSGKLD